MQNNLDTSAPENKKPKRGRPRTRPENWYELAHPGTKSGRPRLKPLPPKETLEQIRAALGVSWLALSKILHVHPKTIKYDWFNHDDLPTAAATRLVKYAHVNLAFLQGKSKDMFLRDVDGVLATARKDGATEVLTSFVATLSDEEKKFTRDLARALNS